MDPVYTNEYFVTKPSTDFFNAIGGYLPLATGVSTVRYPIPQRTFKYVATVQSVTDETCQLQTYSPHRRRCEGKQAHRLWFTMTRIL
jgi:hypothetical protein